MKIAVRFTTLFLLVCTAAIGATAARAAGSEQENFERFGFEATQAELSSPQAGAHADFTTTFSLSKDATEIPFARLRDLTVDLPPGLLGDPTGFPTCGAEELALNATLGAVTGSGCPLDSQVGITNITVVHPTGAILHLNEPIYLMQPPGGDDVARLGFVAFFFPTYIDIEADPARDYALTAKIEGPSALRALSFAETTLWGDPASSVHDSERIIPQETYECNGGRSASEGQSGCEPISRPSGLVPRPFMSNPTRCGEPLSIGFQADSYQAPGHWVEGLPAAIPSPVGCSALGFEPTFTATPTSSTAGAPTGLDVDLKIPQDETVGGRSTSDLKDATVTLPEGMTLAPGAAAGLGSCSADQVGLGRNEEAHCPQSSKIGSARIDVPALEHPIEGAIYQRTPEPGHLFRLWLVADELGAHVKLPGDIALDPRTGRVTTSFLDNPQIPVREIELQISGGSRAPLANPAACGTYQTHYELTPWSGGAAASGDTPMQITQGCGAGGFHPGLTAGTTNSTAGAYSPFTLTVTRNDGEQNISSLDVDLPKGLLAKLAGVELCSGAAAASGSCPAGSQIGTVTVASGPGTSPLWIPQPGKAPTAVYLSGPYKGAPYSLVVKVPAQAGPFDLGTVVTRAGIYVDPMTTAVSVRSDPLPQILEGVPILYRSIRVDIDRPEFTLNPTNCGPTTVGTSVVSAQSSTAAPSARFQVGGCAELGFKPKLALSLKGSTKRAGHPSLKAVLTYPKKGSYANIARAQVELPHSEFLDQGNLNLVCKQADLKAGTCPAKAIYGKVKAWTPLLDKPLEGNVYLGVGFGYKLPALVAELNGQLRVLLVGKIDTGKKGGIRNTFEAVPDAPVEKFVLELKGGPKYGLIENSENLCRNKQPAVAVFTGQNGAVERQQPKIGNSCRKSGSGAPKQKFGRQPK